MASKEQLTLPELQREVALWSQQRWEDRTDYQNRDLPFYRMVALSGAIAQVVGAIADGELFDPTADERLDPDVTKDDLRRSLGQMIVVVTEFASRNGWSMQRIVREAWAEMKGDEWDPYPGRGNREGKNQDRPRGEDGRYVEGE